MKRKKPKNERKFRNRGNYECYDIFNERVEGVCDECGGEIVAGKPMFVRRKKIRILRKDVLEGKSLFKVGEKIILCRNCVKKEDVVKKDRKYIDNLILPNWVIEGLQRYNISSLPSWVVDFIKENDIRLKNFKGGV